MTKPSIDLWRKAIDDIDKEILNLLNYRFLYCKEIGKIKKENNNNIYDSNREEEIINSLKKLEEYPGTVDTLWPEIMKFSKELQK